MSYRQDHTSCLIRRRHNQNHSFTLVGHRWCVAFLWSCECRKDRAGSASQFGKFNPGHRSWNSKRRSSDQSWLRTPTTPRGSRSPSSSFLSASVWVWCRRLKSWLALHQSLALGAPVEESELASLQLAAFGSLGLSTECSVWGLPEARVFLRVMGPDFREDSACSEPSQSQHRRQLPRTKSVIYKVLLRRSMPEPSWVIFSSVPVCNANTGFGLTQQFVQGLINRQHGLVQYRTFQRIVSSY